MLHTNTSNGIGRFAVAAAFALLLPACGGAPAAGPNAQPAPGPGGGGAAANAELVVSNESGRTICYVNFSPTTDPMWGPDRLGSTETIPPGQVRGWQVPADTYDFRLMDCDQRTLMERRQQPIGSGQRRTVTFRRAE